MVSKLKKEDVFVGVTAWNLDHHLNRVINLISLVFSGTAKRDNRVFPARVLERVILHRRKYRIITSEPQVGYNRKGDRECCSPGFEDTIALQCRRKKLRLLLQCASR